MDWHSTNWLSLQEWSVGIMIHQPNTNSNLSTAKCNQRKPEQRQQKAKKNKFAPLQLKPRQDADQTRLVRQLYTNSDIVGGKQAYQRWILSTIELFRSVFPAEVIATQDKIGFYEPTDGVRDFKLA